MSPIPTHQLLAKRFTVASGTVDHLAVTAEMPTKVGFCGNAFSEAVSSAFNIPAFRQHVTLYYFVPNIQLNFCVVPNMLLIMFMISLISMFVYIFSI
jgi:hypothetical protein